MMKEKTYTLGINVDFCDGSETLRSYLLIKTTDDVSTVKDNIDRAAFVLSTQHGWQDFDSYAEYLSIHSRFNPVAKEEFEIMSKCFDGYNQDTFAAYLQKRYGYETQVLDHICDFEVTI